MKRDYREQQAMNFNLALHQPRGMIQTRALQDHQPTASASAAAAGPSRQPDPNELSQRFMHLNSTDHGDASTSRME